MPDAVAISLTKHSGSALIATLTPLLGMFAALSQLLGHLCRSKLAPDLEGTDPAVILIWQPFTTSPSPRVWNTFHLACRSCSRQVRNQCTGAAWMLKCIVKWHLWATHGNWRTCLGGLCGHTGS
jgi:hypothetical protein